MVVGWHGVAFHSHQVGHNRADAFFFVVQHDRCAAILGGTKLERTIGVVSVEWLAVQIALIRDLKVSMFEENHMGCLLAGHVLTQVAVAAVIVDWSGNRQG